MIGSVDELEERLRIWKESGVEYFFVNGIDGNQDFKTMVSTIYQELVKTWFNTNYANQFSNFISSNNEFLTILNEEILSEENKNRNIMPLIKDTLVSFANANGNKSSNSKVNLSSMRLSQFVIVIRDNGLDKIYNGQELANLSAEKITGKIVDIQFKGKLSSKTANKLSKIIQDFTGKEFKQLNIETKIRKKIVELIEKRIGNSSAPQRQILRELHQNFIKLQNFALNMNEKVIRGFLGEVYWTAFWKYILNQELIPTGAMRETSGRDVGQQIPVDIIFEDLGFQVKNFNLSAHPDVIYFPYNEKTSSISNFITHDLELDEGYIDSLERFLFSYGYNRSIDSSFDMIESRFSFILSEFEKTMYEYTLARADKIIDVDKDFKFELINSSSLVNNLNTIYIIGDRFVLASDIVMNIMEGLLDGYGITVEISTFEFNVSQPDLGRRYPQTMDYTNDFMKNEKITFQIKLDLSVLTQNILNKVFSTASRR